VLVADFTFPATANVVVHLGATPVLVDVRTDTYAMDVEDLRRKVTSKSRAILPIDPFGLPYDADAVNAVAVEHGLAVVEDAACAIGGSYKGRPSGSLADVGVFSFHGRKVITTGEGGMVVTDDDALADQLALMRSHGGRRDGFKLRFVGAGFNYRLSDIAGAIGVAQMGKLDTIVSQRRALAAELGALLVDVPGIAVQGEPEGCVHTYQSFVTLLDEGIDRDRVVEDLKSQGVESTIGTYALHAEPFFQEQFGYSTGDLPGSAALGARTLTLPLYPGMAVDAPSRVAEAVHEVLRTL
jgi:dTDP-4-amino-4,6-dideoxygalactose transaminase